MQNLSKKETLNIKGGNNNLYYLFIIPMLGCPILIGTISYFTIKYLQKKGKI